MISNAQLDNEKQSFSYQVELYKDDIEELEENFIRVQKDYKEKSRVCIHLFHFSILNHFKSHPICL
jgi:hypothetical protein